MVFVSFPIVLALVVIALELAAFVIISVRARQSDPALATRLRWSRYIAVYGGTAALLGLVWGGVPQLMGLTAAEFSVWAGALVGGALMLGVALERHYRAA